MKIFPTKPIHWNRVLWVLFKVIFYFPNRKSTIWGIYSEYFSFFGDPLSKSKSLPSENRGCWTASAPSASSSTPPAPDQGLWSIPWPATSCSADQPSHPISPKKWIFIRWYKWINWLWLWYDFIIFHHISSYFIIFHHISSYFIIFHHISSYFIIFHHISSQSRRDMDWNGGEKNHFKPCAATARRWRLRLCGDDRKGKTIFKSELSGNFVPWLSGCLLDPGSCCSYNTFKVRNTPRWIAKILFHMFNIFNMFVWFGQFLKMSSKYQHHPTSTAGIHVLPEVLPILQLSATSVSFRPLADFVGEAPALRGSSIRELWGYLWERHCPLHPLSEPLALWQQVTEISMVNRM